MRFVADENVDRRIVERLGEDGHEIEWIAELFPSVSDEKYRRAAEGKAVLLTGDKDFGELVYRRGMHMRGRLACQAGRSRQCCQG